jgi:GNAT superfamily N-acetyltransferase
MYAIRPLDPSEAMGYLPLTPFDVRPVIADLAALPRVHAVGASLFGRPVGLAIAVRGWAAPGEYDGIAPPATSARLLSITVARSHRRLGIGTALLAAVESAVRDHGVSEIASHFALPVGDAMTAVEALCRSAGWSAPETTMLQCRAAHPLLEAPVMREQMALPPEYEIVDWVDLDDRERAHIRARQQAEPWYPETLDPFHFEAELEVVNSLALRYRGEVVGWLITRRTSPLTMYYRSLFVRSDLARLGRGLALIAEAVRRHHAIVGDAPGYGEWSTPASLPLMVRFIRRHLEPFGAVVIEQRVTRKALAAVAPAGGSGATRTVVDAPVARPLLTTDACAAVVAELHAARDRWTSQVDTLPCHTLGAAAMVDAWDGIERYRRIAAATAPLLLERFGWLYDRLHHALAEQLGAPVVAHDRLAPPAFHHVAWSRGAHLPIAPIRSDSAHLLLAPGLHHAQRPISFVLRLDAALDDMAITEWALGADQTVGLDTEEIARLLDVVPRERIPIAPGTLVVFPSDRYHQRSPIAQGTTRITLEGHGICTDGVWRIFG